MMPLEGFRCISTLYLNREAREEETDGDRSHRLRVGPRKLGGTTPSLAFPVMVGPDEQAEMEVAL
jgi:hypothetical protein